MSRHPLSDEKDSRIDSRLYGIWMFDPGPDMKVAAKPSTAPAHVIGFGKHPSVKNALSLIITTEDTQNGEKQFSIDRMEGNDPVFCSADHTFLSLGNSKEGYLICRYEVESDSQHPRLRIYLLSEERIRKAIRTGDLTGNIVRLPVRAWKPGERRGTVISPTERVTITSSPGQLQEFLKQATDAFNKDALSFRRLTDGDVLKLTEEASPGSAEPPRFSLRILVCSVIGGALIGFAAGMWFRRRRIIHQESPTAAG